MNETRLRRVLEYMKEEGLEQIVVSATASVYYLTGIWVEPMERMLALYIRSDGECTLYANELFGLTERADLPLHKEDAGRAGGGSQKWNHNSKRKIIHLKPHF